MTAILDSGAEVNLLPKGWAGPGTKSEDLSPADEQWLDGFGGRVRSYGHQAHTVGFDETESQQMFHKVDSKLLAEPLLGWPWIREHVLGSSLRIRTKADQVLNFEEDLAWGPMGSPKNEVLPSEDWMTAAIKDLLQKVAWVDGEDTTITGVEHKIVLRDDANPVYICYEEKNPQKREALRAEIQKMLKEHVIQERDWKTEWNLQPLVVPKKDERLRVCANLVPLNRQVKFRSFPIPKEEDLVQRAAKYKYFTKLDMARGYWQIKLASDSRKYTAFTFEGKRYEYRKMPMGLVDSGFTFQSVMEEILGDLEGVFIYIDDVIMGSMTMEEHVATMEEVLRRLKARNVKVRMSKCEFAVQQVEFLGRIIGNGSSSVKDEAAQALRAMRTPETKDELRSLYATANWWHRYVPNFSLLLEPLARMLKKGATFKWGEEQQKAWDAFLEALEEATPLASPQEDDVLVLRTDASRMGCGAALYVVRNGNVIPVSFASTRWTSAQASYSITELEALAVVWAFDRWSVMLDRPPGQVFVETDHLPLLGIWKRLGDQHTVRGRRIRRWFLLLQSYNFNLSYVKGKDMGDADMLSRLSSVDDEGVATVMALVDEEPTTDELLLELHQDLAHVGYKRLADFYRKVTNEETKEADCRRVIDDCRPCALMRRDKARGMPAVVKEATYFMERVHVDVFYLSRNKEQGTRMVVLAQDKFTKWVWGHELTSRASMVTLDVVKDMLLPFGMPDEIVVDSGKEFDNSDFVEFWGRLGTNVHVTTVERHEANGQVERVNRTMKDWLNKSLASGTGKDIWEVILAYNRTVHSGSEYSPIELVMRGQDGTSWKILEMARKNLLRAQAKRVASAAATATELLPFEVGNIVWKIRDSIQHKDQTGWIEKDLFVVKGPYDGDHYDVRARGGRTIRAHREQLKLAVGSQHTQEEPMQVLMTLKEYLYTFEWFQAIAERFERYIRTKPGRLWYQYAQQFLTKLQKLRPHTWKELDVEDVKEDYVKESPKSWDRFKSYVNGIRKFVNDDGNGRSKRLAPVHP